MMQGTFVICRKGSIYSISAQQANKEPQEKGGWVGASLCVARKQQARSGGARAAPLRLDVGRGHGPLNIQATSRCPTQAKAEWGRADLYGAIQAGKAGVKPYQRP